MITSEGQRADMGTFLDSFLLLYFHLHLIYFSSIQLSDASSEIPFCKLRRQFNLNGMHKPGDVILGGLFEVHYTSVFPELTFTSEPNHLRCEG